MATRIRRGKVVEIPPQWVGKVPHDQTARKRPAKGLAKNAKVAKLGHRRVPRPAERRGQPDE